jgi:hypothetical protein
MKYQVVESREIVWCEGDDRFILIIKENDEIIGLNYMQGDELDVFKADFMYIDDELTDFYHSIEPYLDERNDEVGKINAAIWAHFEYRNLRDEREYKNNNK